MHGTPSYALGCHMHIQPRELGGGAFPSAATPTLAGAWGRVLALRPRGCAWRGEDGEMGGRGGKRKKKVERREYFKIRRISKKKTIIIDIERKEENKKEEDG